MFLESVDNANENKGKKFKRSPITCIGITPSPSGRVSGFPNKFHGAKERGRGTLNIEFIKPGVEDLVARVAPRNRAAYRVADKKEKRRKGEKKKKEEDEEEEEEKRRKRKK